MNAKEATQAFGKGKISKEDWHDCAKNDPDPGRAMAALGLNTQYENSDWSEDKLREKARFLYP